MRTKALLLLAIACALAGAALAAEPPTRTWKSGETEITFQLRRLNPPLRITADLGYDSGAIATSLALYRALTTGDMEKVAALSNDPEKTVEKYRQYRERLGDADFRKMFTSYFDGSSTYTHELTIGSHHLLLIEDTDNAALAAQFYEARDGKFLVDEKPSPERDQLGKLFMAIREGKLKL